MNKYELERICDRFVMHAIQEWGDASHTRIAAVQEVLNAAGIDAEATCWPVFGGIWPKPCEGAEAERATAFLSDLTTTMQRGHFEDETAHVAVCIAKARETVSA